MGLFDKKEAITYQEFFKNLESQRRQGKLTQKEFDYLAGYFKPLAESWNVITETEYNLAMRLLEREWRDPVRPQSVQQLKRMIEKQSLRKIGRGQGGEVVEPKK